MFKLSLWEDGRLGRIKYLGLFLFLINLLTLSGVLIIAIPEDYSYVSSFLLLLCIGISLNLIFIKIRRINDFNWSGAWILLSLIPLVGWIFFISIFFNYGTKGKNKYGEQPPAPTKQDYLFVLATLIGLCLLVCTILYLLTSVKI